MCGALSYIHLASVSLILEKNTFLSASGHNDAADEHLTSSRLVNG